MIKAAVLLIFLVAASALSFDLSSYSKEDPTSDQIKTLFQNYMRITPYFAQATLERFEYFSAQILSIIRHNRNPSRTYDRAVNIFTGLTPAELRGYVIMETQPCKVSSSFGATFDKLFDYPTSFDWRDQGFVTPVKNIGSCAASWAFAATGAIESHWAIYTNSTPTQMSEQQLLDCSNKYDNKGCSAGLPSQAFAYVQQNGGINTENTYPYMMEGDSCVYNASVIGAQVAYGSANITAGDEAAIMEALVKYGPVAVAFDATEDFLSYNGGVYVGTTCGKAPQSVNFAALIVGYGTDSATGLDYWICKNALGQFWGEEGYFRIQRGVNMCGIADCASFPAVASVRNAVSM